MQDIQNLELPTKALAEMSLEELAEQRTQLKSLSYEQQTVDTKTTGELRRRLHKLGAELQEFRPQAETAPRPPKPPRKPVHWSALTVAGILTFNSILAILALTLALSGGIRLPGVPAWAVMLFIISGSLIFFILFLAMMGAVIAVYLALKQQPMGGASSYYPMQLPDEAPPWAENHIDKSARLSDSVPVYQPNKYSEDLVLDQRLQDMERGVGSVKSIRPINSDPFSEEM